MPDSFQLTIRQESLPDLSFPLEKDEVSIGRGTKNDITINSQDVSRNHARLIRTGETYSVQDLESTNGTSVNEESIAEIRELALGDVICLGRDIELVFEIRESDDPTLMMASPAITGAYRLEESTRSQVFISYSRKNKDFVEKIHHDLDRQGVKSWVDWEGIPLSADWWMEITGAIESSDAVIVVVSPDSLNSEVCLKEVSKAVELNKRLIPIIFQDPRPEDPIHEKVRAANWVFMRDSAEYRANMLDMIQIIQTDLDWVKEHTRLLIRAKEWEESDRSKSALLRGKELLAAERWLAESGGLDVKPNPLHLEYIHASREDTANRQRRNLYFAAGIAAALLLLTVFAFNQSGIANRERGAAETASTQAVANEQRALNSESTAVANQQIALTQQARAEAASTLAVSNQQLAEAQEATADANRLEAEAAQADAETQRNQALAEAIRAQSSKLAALGEQTLAISPPLSTILALESLAANPSNPEAQDLLSRLPYFYPPIHRFFSGHESDVTALAWSESGGLASGGSSREVFIWDLVSHQPALILDAHTGAVTALDWSPSGQLASASTDGTVIVWDLEAGEPDLVLEQHTQAVNDLAWYGDELLASAGEDGRVLVWDMENENLRVELAGHEGAVYAVAWGELGELVSGGLDKNVIVWDLRTGSNRILAGHTESIRSLSVGPGNVLASGSADSNILIWVGNMTGRSGILTDHTGAVLSLDWDEEGRLISASSDGRVIIWDVSSRQPNQVLSGHSGAVFSAVWGRPGNIFSGASDESIIHWEINIFENTLADHLDNVRAVGWSPDGQQFASTSDDNRVLLWDPVIGEVLRELITHRDKVTDLSWRADGELLTASSDGTIIWWDISQNRSRVILSGHEAPVLSVAWGPDPLIASGDANGRVLLWDSILALSVMELNAHDGEVNDLAWSPDGLLASAGQDNLVHIWDTSLETPIGTLAGHEGNVNALSWAGDGRLASGSSDGTIIIWDIESETPAQVLSGHRGSVTSVAWSMDGRLLSGSDDMSVIYWDLQTGQPARTLRGHFEAVTSVAWYPDGTYLVSGGSDNLIHILPERFLGEPCGWGVRNFLPNVEWHFYFPNEEYRETCQLD